MFTIGAFSSQLGVSPGTLRKWEERYGYPSPSRSSGGTRRYSTDDLVQMRRAKRLIDQGMRPSAVFAEIAIQPPDTIRSGTEISSDTIALLAESLLAHDLIRVRHLLERSLFDKGITTFVESIADPLMVKVGELWATGKLAVFSEHVVSSIMESALHEATRRLRCDHAAPRILLTTPPGEQHRLGLCMIRSVMSAAGAECIDIGSELPLDELCSAITAYAPDVVGVSFSACAAPRYGMRFLRELCRSIDAGPEIWVGGAGVRKMTSLPPALQSFSSAGEVQRRIESIRSHASTSFRETPQ